MFFKKKLPEINYQIKIPTELQQALQLEWLETNSIGGWASSTLIGTSTRRYHGLLVSASDALESRDVLIANQIEVLHVGNSSYNLSTFCYADTVAPLGFRYLKEYFKDPFSRFIYEINNDEHFVKLEKTVLMINNQNSTLITYKILDSNTNLPIQIQLEPLFAIRPYHQLQKNSESVNFDYQYHEQTLTVKPKEKGAEIYIRVVDGNFVYEPRWINKLKYQLEDNRGYDFLEDLFCYGYWNLKLGNEYSAIIFSDTKTKIDLKPFEIITAEKNRIENLIKASAVQDSLSAKLVLAADPFLVHSRSKSTTEQRTVIAGYPWFTDWGRDAMISLPGLCLATGRTSEAKLVLEFFGSKIKDGVIPNRILENQVVEYNSVDASLWFVNAVYRYYQSTKDKKWVKHSALPIIREIIKFFSEGTFNEIKLDYSDGLLTAGNHHTQLTWMDAKVGEWVVTPRFGKAVEINALWYNSLKICEYLENKFGSKEQVLDAKKKSKLFEDNFLSKFWDEEGGYLYDTIGDNFQDKSFRPNQIIATSLDFSPLNKEQAHKIIENVKNELLTPYGLRTLSPSDLNYRGQYFGDLISRDASYHQGTVWAWLLGPYCRSILKTYGASHHSVIKAIIEQVSQNLEQAVIGNISEIFDGDYPHRPRGCPAQAWSVAEILDIWKTIN